MEFYPPGARVPEGLRTDRVLLRPLRGTDVERDYDAVMSSAEQLRGWSQSDWPADGFTLADNLEDLERHEAEHLEREAFTYTVLDPAGARCLGCVYLTPVGAETEALIAHGTYASTVGFWVRTSERASDLDRHLLSALRDWLAREWAFDRVVFTISAADERQASLLADAGLGELGAVTLDDGRACRVFG